MGYGENSGILAVNIDTDESPTWLVLKYVK